MPAPALAQQSRAEDITKLAYEALQAGKLADAEAGFRSALQRNVRDIAACVGLAQTLLKMQRPREAVEMQRKAVDLNPTSMDLRLGLAALLEQTGQVPEAVAETRRAVTLAPNDPRPLVALSEALRQSGRTHEALPVCIRALGLAPDVPAVHQEMAAIAEAQEDWDRAASHYEAMVRLQPGLRQARLSHLNALNSGHRYEAARSIAGAMLTGAPDDLDVRMALASALEGLELRKEAIAEYGRILQAAPTLAVAWGNLGWTQYGAGMLDDAAASSRKALELDPDLSYARFNLGLILACRGDWQQAETEYRLAIDRGTPADIKAGITDIEAALVRKPDDATLKRALELLRTAARTPKTAP
jgi:tetratricopeptide (TPR) repeat protein